jgi:CubicO group peptidase (beta-lactamase class C family)
MHDVLAGYVERGEVPGLVALVSRHGETHVECIGYERETIFRIASMTKPITAAAVMILVEDGVIRLNDPIQKWIPELADRRVLRSLDSPLDDTVPAVRPITVRDCLTFTLGTGVVFAMPGTYPIQAALDESHVTGSTLLKPPADEWLRRLSAFPLVLQPGEAWMYNIGSDVLGFLVERASGQSFEDFRRHWIFEPLGMTDSGAWVATDRIGRLPIAYTPVEGKGLVVEDESAGGFFSSPPAFTSGAGGQVGTVDDFFAFAQMLKNHGRPILSPQSAEAMTTDQLTSEQRRRTVWTPGFFDTHGWGFGVAMDIAEHPGQYGWDGGFGTTWRTDPREDLVAILMTQVGMTSPEGPQIFRDFYTLAYSALE